MNTALAENNAACRLTGCLLFLDARRCDDFIDFNGESASKCLPMWNQLQLLEEAASLRPKQQPAGFNKRTEVWLLARWGRRRTQPAKLSSSGAIAERLHLQKCCVPFFKSLVWCRNGRVTLRNSVRRNFRFSDRALFALSCQEIHYPTLARLIFIYLFIAYWPILKKHSQFSSNKLRL